MALILSMDKGDSIEVRKGDDEHAPIEFRIEQCFDRRGNPFLKFHQDGRVYKFKLIRAVRPERLRAG